ncbi:MULTISPECIES: alpha/beta hydrolase [Gordonia]|nr:MULTISPECIES: alpha/beta hydrolase [Gordonia]NKY94974.1 alpha/beta hydrolase [Gordonia sputi]OBA32914.1 alpha/beta hydrolase [Gordonia sp. 852002-51296_SCH5728562-b]
MPSADTAPPPAPTALIAMPGTGSDDDYVRRAFGAAARLLDVELIAVEPTADLIPGFIRALDAAAREHAVVLVGGVSIGAVTALRWALDRQAAHTGTCAGVLAALPPWSGEPSGSLAAASARLTADSIERDGLDATIAAMVSTSPEWLGVELSRSWRAQSRDLVAQLRAAAECAAPTSDDISKLAVPLALTATLDDPLHPRTIAEEWSAAAPRAEIVDVELTQWGTDPSVLGTSCARAWLRLSAAQESEPARRL